MANDVYQLVMIGTCAGEFWETVQHWEGNLASGADPVGAADALIDGFITTPQPSLREVLATDCFITGYKAKRINNGGGPTVLHPLTPVAGLVTGTSASSATSICIISWFQHLMKFRTGRWFLPGIPEASLDGNHLTAGAISDVATFIADMSSIVSSPFTFTFGTWSGTHNLFHTPLYIAPSNKVGIQRRRLQPVL